MADLACALGPLTLKNPVFAASGTFGFGRDYTAFYDPSVLGGIVTKGLTLQPRHGNRPPRLVETPAGLINAIGLENPGLEAFLAAELPWLKSVGAKGTRVVANIAGETVEEFCRLARALEEAGGVDALELNISCPNVERGGLAFGADPACAAEVVAAVRGATSLPLIAKLSPNVTDIVAVARACAGAGAAVISLINTVRAMVIDVEARRPVLGNTSGGLSGPAVRPIAVRMVYETAAAVDVPLLGMGGIMKTRDALEFILAGAAAVAVGTGSFVEPMAPVAVIRGLEELLDRTGTDYASLIGAANPGRRDGRGGGAG